MTSFSMLELLEGNWFDMVPETRKTEVLGARTQRAKNGLIKAHTLNHIWDV